MINVFGKLIYSVDGVLYCDCVENSRGYSIHAMIRNAKNKYYNNNILIYKYIYTYNTNKYNSEIINKDIIKIYDIDFHSLMFEYDVSEINDVEFWMG